MNATDILTIVFSSTLITTILTLIFNLSVNRKNASLENITKERKTWRDELREVSLSIQKSKNIRQLENAISELKVRINAYGIATNSVFDDSHIWQEISFFELQKTHSPDELDILRCKLVNQISCLLKYDWERSKAEIKGNSQTRILIITIIVSFLLYSVQWFWNYYIGSGKIYNYISFCVVYALFAVFAMLMISFANKWKNKRQLSLFVTTVFIGTILLYNLIYFIVPSASPYSITDWIVSLSPFFALIYCVEFKLLTYRKNVRNYIMSSAISSGTFTINGKYRIFFGRDVYVNIITGEKITFDDGDCLYSHSDKKSDKH